MKVQRGESLLKEMGIYNSHITSFTQQLRQNGWDLDATPVIREEPADGRGARAAVRDGTRRHRSGGHRTCLRHSCISMQDAYVVSEADNIDPDEEITTLTAQWSELVSRKRELAAAQEGLSATIDRLLTQAEEAAQQRDQVTAEAADVAAGITKTKKRLAEMVRED